MRNRLIGALAGIVVVAVLAAGALWAALHSERGSAWLIAWLPRVIVAAPRGALIGDFSATRIEIALPDESGTLRLEAPRWRGLAVGRGRDGRWLRVTVDELHAERVDLVRTADAKPASGKAGQAPESLRLPLEIEIGSVSVDELRLAGADAQPVRKLRGSVHLGAEGGASHRFDALAAGWERIEARGSARLGTDAPFTVASALTLAGSVPALAAWQASATLAGPLAALRVEATLQAESSPAHPAQSLAVRALLHPFAAWPLGELDASTQALDLAAFVGAAPVTSISGHAVATTTGVAQPAIVSIDFANARAGRWNAGLLPVRRLRGELRARADDPRVFELPTFVAELGAPDRDGGRISGGASWTPARWQLDARLEQVVPAALDERAAAMRLDGTLAVSGFGFAAAASPASPASAPSATSIERRLEVDARIQGSAFDFATRAASKQPARPVAIVVDASARERGDELSLEIRRLDASAGSARATLAGTVSRRAALTSWQAKGDLALTDFDPVPWWPGSAGSAWQQGPHRINGKGSFDLELPRRASGGSVVDLLAAVRGSAEATLAGSVFAGVPLQGSLGFRNRAGRAEPTVDLLAAGNRFRAEGRTGGGGADEWQLRIDAPQLASLAPLYRLIRDDPAPARLAGALVATAHVAGRWPELSSDGELAASGVRAGALGIGKATGRWRVGSAPGAALDVSLDLDQASVGASSVERIEAQLKGTARAHRLDVRAESKALPPEWVDAVQEAAAAASAPNPALMPATTQGVPPTTQGVPPTTQGVPPTTQRVPSPTQGVPSVAPSARSVAVVVAEGGLVESGGERAAGWRGVLQRVDVSGLAAPARSWLSGRDLRAEVLWSGGPPRVAVEPGRVHLLGTPLRWSRLAWRGAEAGGAGARLDVQAEVDPLAVAPILARLQPDFGWGGDLKVGLRVDVRSSAGVTADVVLERQSGDLTVTDEYGTQSLGLTDLRFGVAARDGVWNFTQALAGRTLGVAAGAVVARTGSAAVWPSAQTPIEGVLEVQVANLGTWGTWVPAGWRIGGALHASASFGGRFGAPEYTGHVEGTQLSVRNFVQGVNVVDGDVAIALRGTSAQIERFTAKAGTGSLRMQGEASLGEAPIAQLRVTADRFQLLGRVDRRIVTSGSAALKLDRETLALAGSFGVDEGLVDFTRSDAPTLGDDVEVVRRKAGGAAGAVRGDTAPAASPPRPTLAPAAAGAAAPAAVPAPAASRKVALDLRVGLGERLRVRGRGLDAGLRGDLRLTSPNGRLAVNGTVSAVDGTYAAYGQKLTIDRGLLSFAGAVENPRLDIEATRPNLDLRVGVTVTGTALNPRVRLFSEPDLSEMDKLSWLVLGRASEGVGRADTALLQRAALALLSGEGPGVTDRLTQAIGLDEISVRQSEGEVKETIVSLGKQISKRWYVGYERGLNATTGSWQLIYRIARRLTVRAQAGGDNSLDLIWTLRWR